MADISSSPDTVACPSCGATNAADAKFCEDCGRSLESGAQAIQPQPAAAQTVMIRTEDLVRLQPESAPAEQSRVAFKSDIGRSHRVNQDAGGAWAWTREDGTAVSLLVVADGVSAGRHSEGASRLAVDVIYERVAPLLQDTAQGIAAVLGGLTDAVKEANHRICERPHQAIQNADATTVVAAFTVANRAAGVWVGDTRVYRVSGGDITRLTTDHSWAEGVVSTGIMSAEQASRDPRAHMIVRWLGPPDQEDPGIETFQVTLDPGDIVFCCTDGLYMYFASPAGQEEDIARIFEAHGADLNGAVNQLVDVGLERGGHDDISVAAVQVTGTHTHEVAESETDVVPAPEAPARADQTVRLKFPRRRGKTHSE